MAFLKWEDYVVLVLTVALSLGMGLYQSLRGTKLTTTSQYIMGDGNMPILPVALSFIVSFESGIMLLGIPAEVYLYGMQVFMSFIGYLIADLLCMYFFIPHLKRLEITSIFEYLEVRYDSHGIRLFGTVLSILFGVNYMGNVLAMPALALKAVAGIDIWTSIIGLMVVVLVYTLIGGFKAVIWSDVIQALLMFGGMFAVIIKCLPSLNCFGILCHGRFNDVTPGTVDAGGLVATWKTVYETGRLNFFVFDVDPTVRQSFWSVCIGSAFLGLTRPFLQTSFLRIKATPNIQTTQRMYLTSSLLSLVIPLLAAMGGAIMFAYYNKKGCDPLTSKQLDNSNQLMAAMVTEIFKDTPCLPGLFLSTLFCASLSTLSSVLGSTAAVFWEDIVKPHTNTMSERRGITINKLSVLGFGVVGVAIAVFTTQVEGPVIQIFTTTSSVVTGTMGGIFILGLTIPWANKLGALVGGASSVFLVGWITVGKMTSSGIRRSPKLESASIENCSIFNISTTTLDNTTFTTPHQYNINVPVAQAHLMNFTKEPEAVMNGPHGLDVLYSISFRWLGAISIITVVLVGAIASRLTGRSKVAPELVVPVCDLLRCCNPETIKENLRGGVKYHNPNATKPDQPEIQDKMRDIALSECPAI